ncbi:trichothecene efflux pump [Ilyonectria robusta]|uniref:trichothecene efflux pump n=1 Tax=Ilyonectria robusta TaxID=1079257 RepID=UPI001E8DA153|nr:trichothecene efflux pump [Ilyonectria robusta]KAH8684143.1 trichothecene efflux pump [Ilyonectria robusta]
MSPDSGPDEKDLQATHLEAGDAALSKGVEQTEKVVHADGTIDYLDAKAVGGDVDEMPKGYFLSAQFIGTVTAQCLGSICAYLGWVLPANTLTLINQDIGPSANINWVATMWTMGSSIGFLLFGRLSDMYGRKYMVLGCTVLGLIGCIIGSCAQSVEMLIAANVCNGIAAAGQLSFGIVLGELVPNKWRGPITTLVFLSSLPFAVFGPVIARAFFENTSSRWRWSYFIGDILGAMSLVLYWFFYHPPDYNQLHVNGKSKWQMTKDLDFIGIFLYISGCVLFLIGLSWGGTQYPWDSAETLCTLLIGVALLASTVYTTNVTDVGWQSSVVGGGILLGQSIAGFCISYVPKVKYQCIIASGLAFAFMTSLTTISIDRWAATIALGVLTCTSIGFVENISFPGVTLIWEPQDIGLATGVLGSIRGFGGAIAQSLYVSVLNNQLVKKIPEHVIPAAKAAGLPESSMDQLLAGTSTGDFSTVPGITDSIISSVAAAMKDAYIGSYKIVFYTTIPFSVILFLMAFFVPNMEKFLGNNVAKKLQRHH